MRTLTVIESQDSTLSLSAAEAADLAAIGASLASKATWWGADAEGDDETDRSVLRVRPLGEGRWLLRVSDAVGVISTGALQLIVEPKIPVTHLLYLLAKSGEFPRLDHQAATSAASASLWELVAHWFVDATERLLRLGLVRDYLEVTDTLESVSGRIELQGTADHYFAGRLAVDCTFDEYAFDTPLNRVLLAALKEVTRSPVLDSGLRRRSLRLTARLDDVGPLQTRDTTTRLDRRTGHYATAFILAGQVLRHLGRHISAGAEASWTFLVRTPEMVEAGIRQLLVDRLGPRRVTKQGRQLVGSSLTFNPDLVFDDGLAVGDVKYKLSGGQWHRTDLYQTIAFAEAFGASRGLVVRFRRSEIPPAPALLVGRKGIQEITWLADTFVDAGDAARALCDDVAAWLEGDQSRADGGLLVAHDPIRHAS